MINTRKSDSIMSISIADDEKSNTGSKRMEENCKRKRDDQLDSVSNAGTSIDSNMIGSTRLRDNRKRKNDDQLDSVSNAGTSFDSNVIGSTRLRDNESKSGCAEERLSNTLSNMSVIRCVFGFDRMHDEVTTTQDEDQSLFKNETATVCSTVSSMSIEKAIRGTRYLSRLRKSVDVVKTSFLHAFIPRQILGSIKIDDRKKFKSTFMSVVFGVILGVVLKLNHINEEDYLNIIRLPGQVFLGSLSCINVPLTVVAIINGVLSLGSRLRLSYKIGILTFGYILVTSVVTIVTSFVLGFLFSPVVEDLAIADIDIHHTQKNVADFILDFIRHIFPHNLITTLVFTRITSYEERIETIQSEVGENCTVDFERKYYARFQNLDAANMTGVIVITVSFALALQRLEYARADWNHISGALFHGIAGVSNFVFDFLAPLGVVCLIASNINDNDFSTLSEGYDFVLLNLLCHGVHIFIGLPLIYYFIVGDSPRHLITNSTRSLITAFTTCSSAATMPANCRELVKSHRIDARVVLFVTPIGTALHMNGSCIYKTLTFVYLLNIRGISITFRDYFLSMIMIIILSFEHPGIPNVGSNGLESLVTIYGIPIYDMQKCYRFLWFLDMFETTTNVFGDVVLASIVEKHVMNELIEENTNQQHLQSQGSMVTRSRLLDR